MARADLPALHIRAVRHDPVPPQRRDVMYLIVERVPFEGPHQCALPRRIGLVQHFLIEIDRRRVVKVSVLLGEDRGGLVFADIEQRVDDALAITFERHFEIAATQRLDHGPVGATRWLTSSPTLLHSSTSQVPRYLKG